MKPGYKTSEFWLTLLANLLPFIAAATPDPQTQAVVAGVTASVYAGSRAYAKAKGK